MQWFLPLNESVLCVEYMDFRNPLTSLISEISILSFRYDYTTTAFLLILFHDFLDHLDGIVAKVQKTIYGQIDDPLLGGFMDAFCDKVGLFITDYVQWEKQNCYFLPPENPENVN